MLLVNNGKIIAVGDKRQVKIPKSAKILDCRGLVLTAGFWNSHIHLTEPQWQNAASIPAAQLTRQVQEMLTRYGFIHVLDTGSFPENTLAIKRRIEKGEVHHPAP